MHGITRKNYSNQIHYFKKKKKKKISFEEIKISRSIASGIKTPIVRPKMIQFIYRYFLPKSYDSFTISFQHNQQTKQRIVITSKSARKKREKNR